MWRSCTRAPVCLFEKASQGAFFLTLPTLGGIVLVMDGIPVCGNRTCLCNLRPGMAMMRHTGERTGDNMKIGMIGAGKVGFSLGKWFAQGGVPVSGYYSRSPESAREAADFTDSRYFESIKALVDESDAVFITVPDAAIPSVYAEVRQFEIRDKYICHCSGVLSSADAFPGVADAGGHGISIHPLFPFSSRYETWRELMGAFFCLEGDEEALRTFGPLLEGLGARVQVIAPEGRARYHAACVAASNFMCVLMQESLKLLAGCGFPEELARQALAPLMRSNLEHLLKDGPVKALTGPVERCDTTTVGKHLNALEDGQLYRTLSLALVDLAEKKHPETDYREMRKLLSEERKTS